MATPFANRIDAAVARMRADGVGCLLVGQGADLRYLTGYDAPPLERLTLLVLTSTGEVALVLPELEKPRALSQGVDVPLLAWGETEDPFASVAKVAGTQDGIACVSDRLWATFVLRLQAVLPHARFEPASRIAGPLRVRKDADEIALLRESARIADRVAEELGEERIGGRTERELSRWIGDRLLAEGCERINFAIVAAGENAASPHHEPTDRPISYGDAIVCDFGGTLEGYCSDITRTFVAGTARDELKQVHDIVARAQERGVEAARAGVAASSVDAAARAVIAEAGYGERFIHRVGHGIGLEEHEEPYLVGGNDTLLAPGMAFSVEPGIYIPGSLGVRIEDIVVCAEGGPQRLNEAPRELLSIPV